MRISVIGTGYVGLVSGACFAEIGHDCICVDVDASKVERINRGEPPIHENGLEALLRRHVGTRLRATTDLSAAVHDSDITFIAVGSSAALMRASLAYGVAGDLDPDQARAVFHVSVVTDLFSVIFFAAFAAAVGVASVRTGFLPRWWGWQSAGQVRDSRILEPGLRSQLLLATRRQRSRELRRRTRWASTLPRLSVAMTA